VHVLLRHGAEPAQVEVQRVVVLGRALEARHRRAERDGAEVAALRAYICISISGSPLHRPAVPSGSFIRVTSGYDASSVPLTCSCTRRAGAVYNF
jgi:hypothetical protein